MYLLYIKLLHHDTNVIVSFFGYMRTQHVKNNNMKGKFEMVSLR